MFCSFYEVQLVIQDELRESERVHWKRKAFMRQEYSTTNTLQYSPTAILPLIATAKRTLYPNAISADDAAHFTSHVLTVSNARKGPV